ncbi:MAG: 1-deoxy-D-xylulose-5-phosphate synthase [Desulfatibacillum sp.]|nr:1-deoxy-D-xylulose-5-phosphate synthase [Desulfatibacillum sp.]
MGATTYLKNIQSPEDLKKLPIELLPLLAAEIRELIIETVSRTGGHLAPSLGTVELTIALHYVFNSPQDKIIWDVGHQSYTHKILTGRAERFSTLRSHGGLSGFCRRSESPYDAFSVGHSSTSISAGAGVAAGKCLNGDRSKVISVIGDGSMTAGLAYEGLNHAGDLKKDLIVVLNDNEMSIAPNVGALSNFLSRKLTAKTFQDWRNELKGMLRPAPNIYNLFKRMEESFKAFVTPGMLFEAFDFQYIGPIDGHRLDHLIKTLENVKNIGTPVLFHTTTVKGKGYEPAEKNPSYFHGVGSFEVATGSCRSSGKKAPSYTQVFGDTIVELARENKKIVAVTAAMPEGTGLTPFHDEFPTRFFDVGIAEQHGVTFAAGLATEGFRPVVAIYSTFMQRAFDQVLHDVCLESLPVIFAMDRGGLVGEDGPTHHGAFDLSFMRCIPNLVIMAPKDEDELRHMLFTALNHNGPVAIRYPRGQGLGVPLSGKPCLLPMGKAEILHEGDDVVFLAVGRMVCEALEARKLLAERGVSAGVVNCRFIKPVDGETIAEVVKKVPRVVTAEDNALMGGFGSAVLESIQESGITGVRVSRVGLPDRFVEHGAPGILRSKYGVDAQGLIKAATNLLNDFPLKSNG